MIIAKKSHGMTGTRIYRIHKAMRTRCYNPNFPAYKYYGGKGIEICKEWDDFNTFYKWAMENGYDEHLTIDRINGNDDYKPENCRWITLADQQRNKDNNVVLYVDGEKLSMREASEKYNVPISVLQGRRFLGASDEDMVKPKKRDIQHLIRGEYMLLEEASIKYNIPWSTLRWRHNQGITGDNLLEKQPRRTSKEMKALRGEGIK